MKHSFVLTPYFFDEYSSDLETISRRDWAVIKRDLEGDEKQLRMSSLHQSLAEEVEAVIQMGATPVSIAGDCCATIGVEAGLQRANVDHTLVWFDAHGDFNTWETTPSDFLGGMPLAMLVGRGEQTMIERIDLEPLEEETVILSDARDLDSGERISLKDSAVKHVPQVSGLIDHPLPEKPLYIHFDVDVLDPSVAPAMNYPAPDGPDERDLELVFRHLARRRKIAAVSVSTWDPALAGSQQTREVCMRLLSSLLEA